MSKMHEEKEVTTTKPQSALEPCPFCGGVAVLGMFNIWCARCEAQIRKDVDAAPDDMIKRWNARAPTSAAPVVDALCTALETAINSVECSSVDSDTREELPWYKQAHEALRLAGRPWKGIRHE